MENEINVWIIHVYFLFLLVRTIVANPLVLCKFQILRRNKIYVLSYLFIYWTKIAVKGYYEQKKSIRLKLAIILGVSHVIVIYFRFHFCALLQPICAGEVTEVIMIESSLYFTGNYVFKVNNRNTRTRYELYSKLTIKTPKRRQWHRSGVFINIFEHIPHLVIVFILFLNAGWVVPKKTQW